MIQLEINHRFHGVFTALLTPMNEDESIDFESMERLIQQQLQSGIQGFYVGGSTGEGFLLTREERMEVLERVIKHVEGRVRVVAHVGSMSTKESVLLAMHAETSGADAVSAVMPFYYKVREEEVRFHYETIMSAVKLPMIIYHYPGATGVQLPIRFYSELSQNPRCLGVKFTSLNLFEMQQIREACGESFLIWNGHDEVFSGGALMAANGATGSTMNIMPQLYTSMYRAILNEDWKVVRQHQIQANTIIAHMLQFDVIPYEKEVLFAQGVIASPTVRMPLRKLTSAERQVIRAFAQQNEVLKSHIVGHD